MNFFKDYDLNVNNSDCCNFLCVHRIMKAKVLEAINVSVGYFVTIYQYKMSENFCGCLKFSDTVKEWN